MRVVADHPEYRHCGHVRTCTDQGLLAVAPLSMAGSIGWAPAAAQLHGSHTLLPPGAPDNAGKHDTQRCASAGRCVADGLCVCDAAARAMRRDDMRRHQTNIMTEATKLLRPSMCPAACLDTHQTRRHLRKILQGMVPIQAPANHDMFPAVHTMDRDDVLCQVEANSLYTHRFCVLRVPD